MAQDNLQYLLASDSEAFRAIFESSNEGILVVDSRGIIVANNLITNRLFGYEGNDLMGEHIEILVPAATRAAHVNYRNHYNKHPEPRIMGVGRDLFGQRKNGSKFPIEVSLSTTKLKSETVVVAFVIDISERKRIEEALKRSEEELITYATELEKRVSQRTQDLNKTIRKLEETNERLNEEISERVRAEKETRQALSKERELNELKSRFVSMASHEFRTPLSSIMSSVSLIQKHIEKNSLDRTGKHIDRIKNSVKNLTDILNDFLNLGKLEEGIIKANFHELKLEEFLPAVIEQINNILRPGQYVSLQIQHGSMVSDPNLLKNIVINLVSNASKYSPEDTEIAISVRNEDDHLVLSIKDNGMGIPENEQVHLFERFFRAKNAMNIQGTGLGLNIVKKYVDLLEGEITFTSKLGIGSTFTVSLPNKKLQNEENTTD